MGAIKFEYCDSHYDPEISRFLSKDPIGIQGGDLNLYRFVGNNPLSFLDPMGLDRATVNGAREFLEARHPGLAPSRGSIIIETDLFEYFDDKDGLTVPFTNIIFIQSDLTPLLTTSILAHEAQHQQTSLESFFLDSETFETLHNAIRLNQDTVETDFNSFNKVPRCQ